jgi:hypothetical protein
MNADWAVGFRIRCKSSRGFESSQEHVLVVPLQKILAGPQGRVLGQQQFPATHVVVDLAVVEVFLEAATDLEIASGIDGYVALVDSQGLQIPRFCQGRRAYVASFRFSITIRSVRHCSHS